MITQAKLKHFGVPALKVRRFASTIKGEPVERALAILDLQSSPTCQTLGKLLRSAIANAVNNHQLSPEFLQVSNVLVDQGPTMKRIHPRARGRAYRIMKRSSHVTIELDMIAGQGEQRKAEDKKEDKSRRTAKDDVAKATAKPKAKASTAKKAADKSEAKPKASKAKPAAAKAESKKSKPKTDAKPAAAKTAAKKAKPKTKPDKGEDKE